MAQTGLSGIKTCYFSCGKVFKDAKNISINSGYIENKSDNDRQIVSYDGGMERNCCTACATKEGII